MHTAEDDVTPRLQGVVEVKGKRTKTVTEMLNKSYISYLIMELFYKYTKEVCNIGFFESLAIYGHSAHIRNIS